LIGHMTFFSLSEILFAPHFSCSVRHFDEIAWITPSILCMAGQIEFQKLNGNSYT